MERAFQPAPYPACYFHTITSPPSELLYCINFCNQSQEFSKRRKLRRASQPISMSLYALSKSPEYHGSTTSDLQNRNKYPFTSKNSI